MIQLFDDLTIWQSGNITIINYIQERFYMGFEQLELT